MCGLFGAASNYLSYGEIDSVINLGILSTIRGKHSSGIALVTENNTKTKEVFKVYTKRAVIPACVLMSDHGIQKMLFDRENGDRHAILGHARAATFGSVIEANAHPFTINHIIGAHNGTIDKFIPKKEVEYEETTTAGVKVIRKVMVAVDPNMNDSRILFENMANKGEVEAIRELEDVGGAAALTWINRRDNTINFYRNDKRPLYFAYSNDDSTIYWASDTNMFDLVRNNGDRWTMGIPYTVSTNLIYKLRLGQAAKKNMDRIVVKEEKSSKLYDMFRKNKQEAEEKELSEEAKVQEAIELRRAGMLKDAKLPAVISRGQGDNNEPMVSDEFLPKFLGKKKEKVFMVSWTGFYPLAKFNEDSASSKLSCGCAYCSQVKEPSDVTHWVSMDTYICDECIDTDFVKEYVMSLGTPIESTCEWI